MVNINGAREYVKTVISCYRNVSNSLYPYCSSEDAIKIIDRFPFSSRAYFNELRRNDKGFFAEVAAEKLALMRKMSQRDPNGRRKEVMLLAG